MVKILGLDISSTSTGYCVFNNGRLVKSSLDVIKPEGKTHGEKLCSFAKEVTKLLHKHKPDKVVIEDIFRGPNVNTFKVLAMFRGVCYYILFKELGIIPICIMPTSARKLVKAKGVTKEDGFEFAIKKYNLKYSFDEHNDITDAIVLGLACHEMDKQGIKESDLRKKKRRKRKKKK